MADRPIRILILGGGFGGVYAALALEKLLRRELRGGRVELGLVNRDNYMVFQPMLPEVISGSIGLVDTITPIRRLCPSTNLYTRAIEKIDLSRKRVSVAVGFGSRMCALEYDHLVIALGTVTSFAGHLGLAEHALPFGDLGDALALRNASSRRSRRQTSSRTPRRVGDCSPSSWPAADSRGSRRSPS